MEEDDPLGCAVRGTLFGGTVRSHRARNILGAQGNEVCLPPDQAPVTIGVDHSAGPDTTVVTHVTDTGRIAHRTVTGRMVHTPPLHTTIESAGVVTEQLARSMAGLRIALVDAGTNAQEVGVAMSDLSSSVAVQQAIHQEQDDVLADVARNVSEEMAARIRRAVDSAVQALESRIVASLLGGDPAAQNTTPGPEKPQPKKPDMTIPTRKPRRVFKP